MFSQEDIKEYLLGVTNLISLLRCFFLFKIHANYTYVFNIQNDILGIDLKYLLYVI